MGYSIATESENKKTYFSVGTKKFATEEETEKMLRHCFWLVTKESLKKEKTTEITNGNYYYTSLGIGLNAKVEGMLKSIRLVKKEGGKQGSFWMWEIELFDDNGEIVIGGDLESSYIEDFMKRIGNSKINFDLPLIIRAYNIKDGNYWNQSMCIYQRDIEDKEQLIDRFYNAYKELDVNKKPILDKDGKPKWVSVNGYPLLEEVKTTDEVTGETKTEYSNRKRLAFMSKIAKEITAKLEEAKIKRQEALRAKEQAAKPVAQPVDLPTEEIDDLPF